MKLKSQVGNKFVSTVKLPMTGFVAVWDGDRGGDDFETMVFPCDDKGEVTDWGEEFVRRYRTEAEAEAGHARVVAALEKGEQP